MADGTDTKTPEEEIDIKPIIKEEPEDLCEDFAKPGLEKYIDLVTCDHWADIAVTAESDEEQEAVEAYNEKTPKSDPSDGSYLCKLCDYESQNIQFLLKHMIRKHSYLEPPYYVCEFCGYKTTEIDIDQHLKKHVPEKQTVVVTTQEVLKLVEGPKRSSRFTKDQVEMLNKVFENQNYISQEIKYELAKKLNVKTNRIGKWFSKRRSLNKRHRR